MRITRSVAAVAVAVLALPSRRGREGPAAWVGLGDSFAAGPLIPSRR